MADPKPLKYVDPTTVDADYEGVAQPVAIYDLPTGEGGVTLPINGEDVVITSEEESADLVTTVEVMFSGINEARTEMINEDRIGVLPASRITSGTFAVARIPDITISKVTGLEARLAAIEAQLGGEEPSS